MDRKYGLVLDVGKTLKDNDSFDAQKNQQQNSSEPEVVAKSTKSNRYHDFINKYSFWCCIVVLVLLSGFVLSQPASLYNIEVNVRNNLESQYRHASVLSTDRDFPSSTPQEKAKIVDAQVQQFVQSADFENRVQKAAGEFKTFYQDDTGQTYLYNADPYYFFRLARNIVEYGAIGDKTTNGVLQDSLRFFPNGDAPGINIFPQILFYFFKVSRIIFPSFSLIASVFYFPVFMGVLSVLCIFLIARKLSDEISGFITALLFAIHPVFLFWNYAGYSDTQVVAQFWSLLAILLFVYAIDISKKKRALFAAVLLLPVLYLGKFIWSGLFFIVVVMLAFVGVWLAVFILRKAVFEKKNSYWLVLLLLFFIASSGLNYFYADYWPRVSEFLNTGSANTLFPTAFSSVTELQGTQTFGRLFVALGGALMIVAFLIEFLFFAKSLRNSLGKYELLPFVWFGLLIVPAFASARFLFFMLPPFALIAGRGFSRIAFFVEKLLTKILKLKINFLFAKTAGIIIVCILLFSALNPNPFVAKTKLPFMTKSIADVSDYIRLNSARESVIATVWDTGYLWQAFARRPTFFDGGLFNTPRLYWSSKAFVSENDSASSNIFNMLSCNGDTWLQGFFDKWANTAPEKIVLFENALAESPEKLNKSLEKVDVPLRFVSCNKGADVFVVVTESMLYQLPSFEHYAEWDFSSANIRKSIAGLSENDAVAMLQSKYNLSADVAQSAYFGALSFKDEIKQDYHIDRISDCENNNDKLSCDNGFVVDLQRLNATYQGFHPDSLMLVKDQKTAVVNYADAKVNFSMVVYAVDGAYRAILMDAPLTKTALVRMFAGAKLNNFEQVFVSKETPERIVVYKIKRK